MLPIDFVNQITRDRICERRAEADIWRLAHFAKSAARDADHPPRWRLFRRRTAAAATTAGAATAVNATAVNATPVNATAVPATPVNATAVDASAVAPTLARVVAKFAGDCGA